MGAFLDRHVGSLLIIHSAIVCSLLLASVLVMM